MVAMHILLIEDDLDLGQALLQALRQGGFTVQWLRSVAATPLANAPGRTSRVKSCMTENASRMSNPTPAL